MPTSKGAICFEFTNYQRTNNLNDFHRVWWLSQLTNCTFQKLFEHLELVVIFLHVQNYDLYHIPSISITLENLKILCANFQNNFVISVQNILGLFSSRIQMKPMGAAAQVWWGKMASLCISNLRKLQFWIWISLKLRKFLQKKSQ